MVFLQRSWNDPAGLNFEKFRIPSEQLVVHKVAIIISYEQFEKWNYWNLLQIRKNNNDRK